MPVVKIKREHKFGIVSLTRAKELLSKPPEQPAKRRPRPALIPEINQAFISKYNSKAKEDRASLEDIIKGALQHAKYKVGLIHATHPKTSTKIQTVKPSSNYHASIERSSPAPSLDSPARDVSYGWLELTQLSQCDSPLQQEILLTLCKSLNHSPISVLHISSLFHIAGLCYQWLKGEYLAQTLLRTGELLLLKIAYLVCLRLYCHHLSGYLVDCCTKGEIRQLRCDLEGFETKEVSYRNLPESLFYWKFCLEVGLLICEYYHGSKSVEDIQRLSQMSIYDNKEKVAKGVQMPSPGTSTTSCGGRGMCSVLWHSLDLWHCVKQGSDVLQEAIQDFLFCSIDFKEDMWMEGFLAMSILCTTSEISLRVLNLVQSLASTSGCSRQSQQAESTSKTQITTQSLAAPASKEKAKLRFVMPQSMELGGGAKGPVLSTVREDSSNRQMPTLNMLGMQPDFNIPDGESMYTEARTEPSQPVTRDEDINMEDYRLVSTKTTSVDYIRHMHGTQTTFMRMPHSYTPDTVRTQSLIENESIPDPLPSALNSNTSVMDITGSLLTVDLGESLGKSAGHFLTSSNSKNLDISVSNLVSSCILPSGDFESIDEDATQSFPSGGRGKELKFSTDRSNSTLNQSSANQRNDRNNLSEPNAVLLNTNQAKLSFMDMTEEQENTEERNLYSRCTNYTHSTAPLAGGANMLGSMVHPSTIIRQSGLYSTQSGPPLDKTPLEPLVLCSWPNEVVLAYIHGMACCTIYGRTSIIQKTAMQGFVREHESPKSKKNSSSSCAGSKRARQCGLLDLVEFKNSTDDENVDYPDWFVRYMSVVGLYRVARTCQLLPMKDDFSTVAWTKLMDRQSREQDQRVLNAFTVAQGIPEMDNSIVELNDYLFSSPLIAHIADELSSIYLPPLQTPHNTLPDVAPTKNKSAQVAHKKNTVKVDYKDVQARVDTRIDVSKLARQDLMARRFGKLNEIVTEDWKRQMEREEEEEKEKSKELLEKPEEKVLTKNEKL